MQISTFFAANLCIKTFIPLIYSHSGWTSYDAAYRLQFTYCYYVGDLINSNSSDYIGVNTD